MRAHASPILALVALALLLPASPAPTDVPDSPAGCPLAPSSNSAKPAYASVCVPRVEVNGVLYTVGVGRFLDEESLFLEEYASISRASESLGDVRAWSLDGVSPRKFLVMNGGSVLDASGMPMDYAVLWGAGLEVPATLCQYLDNSDPQYPARECPLEVGHTYQVEIVTACGLDGPLSSPLGGVYWEPLAVVGDFHGPLQYGTLELTSPDEAVFISEFGSVLELGRTEAAAMGPCPVFPGQ